MILALASTVAVVRAPRARGSFVPLLRFQHRQGIIVTRILLAILLAFVTGCASLTGGQTTPQPSRDAPGQSQRASAREGLRPFAELTRGAERIEGYFDFYQKGEQLFLAVPAERLGEEFLLVSKISRGIGAAGIYGGTMLNIFEGAVVSLDRQGDRVLLVQHPHRFTAPEGSPVARAVELSFAPSVLEAAKIESVRGDSALVINVHDWFVSDLSNVGLRVRGATSRGPGQQGTVNFDRGRSYLESVKSFPENVSIRSMLTFRPAQPVGMGSVPDSRYIPVGVHYTLAKLPEEPMTPRLADDRVGFFMTVRKDFSQDDVEFFQRYVNRWRLERGESAGNGLYYPKKPIVYYLDRTIPEEYRPYMMEGVEAWNAAFEAAGFKDAVRAELLPDDADAEDIRYATLRWNTSDQPGYGAIGPSIVDPRTGEILDSDQLYEANMVRGWKREWRIAVSPSTAIREVFEVSHDELASLAGGGEMSTLAAELSAQGTLLRAELVARGDIDPGEAVPMEYVGQALRWVTMHEVGHTLGLRHNFRSASDTPLESLHDPEWARERGIYSSVMEYPSVNIPPRGTPTGYHYNPGVGSYDRWAISFGYTPDPEDAKRIARQGAMPGHAYGTDEDARGPGSLDPSVAVYHLSGDPLGWGQQRVDLVKGLWTELPRAVLADNTRFAELTDAFRALLFQYARALSTAPKYIGGQFQYRDRVGDPQGRDPFVPVSRAKQREALDFLNTYAFGPEAFDIPPEVLARFGANRWSHWGESNTFGGRIDYPLHDDVLGIQSSLLDQMLHPMVFARIRDAELKFGTEAVLPIPELMEEIGRAVWSEVWTGARNVPAMRRDLQRAHLDRMTALVATPPDNAPADARSVARYRLRDLGQRIDRALASAGRLDAYSRAHLMESRARVTKALDAGLEVEAHR
jgi:hypothetical protein